MTHPGQPTDEELAQRIRRSMSHYTFDRPLHVSARGRDARVWNAARLVAAGMAGAVMTLVVLALLRDASSAPSGNPSPNPSATQTSGAPLAPSPSGSADAPTEGEAAVGCLSLAPGEVVDEWVAEGETAESVAVRIARLPLVLRDDRADGSVLVFADDRFVVMCEWAAAAPAPEGIARALRVPAVDPSVKLLVAFSERDGAEPPTPDFIGDQISIGVVRDDVARVVVVLDDRTRVDALVRDGVWMAWWDEPVEAASLLAYDADGTLIDESPADPTEP